MSISQLVELKSVTKNVTEVTLKISSNVFGDFNDEKNFPQKLLLTNTQSFAKLFQKTPHLIQNYQKLNCTK